MSETHYLLRANFFGYNDEYYYIDDYSEAGFGKLCAVSASLDEITRQWQALELAAYGELSFDGLDPLVHAPREALEQYNTFAMKVCGQPLFSIDSRTWNIPSAKTCAGMFALLGPGQGLHFLQMAGLCRYKLIKVASDETLYVARRADTQAYVFAEGIDEDYTDESRAAILFSNRRDELIGWMAYHGKGLLPEPWRFEGGLPSLTDHPTLLRSLLDTTPKLKYDEQAGTLHLLGQDTAALTALYPLLRTPPFLIETVSPEALLSIQHTHQPPHHRT